MLSDAGTRKGPPDLLPLGESPRAFVFSTSAVPGEPIPRWTYRENGFLAHFMNTNTA